MYWPPTAGHRAHVGAGAGILYLLSMLVIKRRLVTDTGDLPIVTPREVMRWRSGTGRPPQREDRLAGTRPTPATLGVASSTSQLKQSQHGQDQEDDQGKE